MLGKLASDKCADCTPNNRAEDGPAQPQPNAAAMILVQVSAEEVEDRTEPNSPCHPSNQKALFPVRGTHPACRRIRNSSLGPCRRVLQKKD